MKYRVSLSKFYLFFLFSLLNPSLAFPMGMKAPSDRPKPPAPKPPPVVSLSISPQPVEFNFPLSEVLVEMKNSGNIALTKVIVDREALNRNNSCKITGQISLTDCNLERNLTNFYQQIDKIDPGKSCHVKVSLVQKPNAQDLQCEIPITYEGLNGQAGTEKIQVIKKATPLGKLAPTVASLDFGVVSKAPGNHPMASITLQNIGGFAIKQISFESFSHGPFHFVHTTCSGASRWYFPFFALSTCQATFQIFPEEASSDRESTEIIVHYTSESEAGDKKFDTSLILNAQMTTPSTTNSTASTNSNRIFVSSQQYRGDLGGIEGADSKCQALANTAKLPGRWVALLGVGNYYFLSRPIFELIALNGHLFNMKGEQVSFLDPRTDAFYDRNAPKRFQSAVKYNEFGDRLSQDSAAWTGQSTNGQDDLFAPNCSKWSGLSAALTAEQQELNLSYRQGLVGAATETEGLLGASLEFQKANGLSDFRFGGGTGLIGSSLPCTAYSRLYCVEQTVGSAADLAISNLEANPFGFGNGTYRITIQNRGPGNPRQPIELFLESNQNLFNLKDNIKTSFFALAPATPAPGKSIQFYINPFSREVLNQLGNTLTLAVKLDPRNIIEDSNRQNNLRSIGIVLEPDCARNPMAKYLNGFCYYRSGSGSSCVETCARYGGINANGQSLSMSPGVCQEALNSLLQPNPARIGIKTGFSTLHNLGCHSFNGGGAFGYIGVDSGSVDSASDPLADRICACNR